MDDILKPLGPAIYTQLGYTVPDVINRFIAKQLNWKDRSLLNLAVGFGLVWLLSTLGTKWKFKLPPEFINGISILGFTGLASFIKNSTDPDIVNKTKDPVNITINDLIATTFGLPGDGLAGDGLSGGKRNGLGQYQPQLYQLTDGSIVDQFGNVYYNPQMAQQQIQQYQPMYYSPYPQVMYGDKKKLGDNELQGLMTQIKGLLVNDTPSPTVSISKNSKKRELILN